MKFRVYSLILILTLAITGISYAGGSLTILTDTLRNESAYNLEANPGAKIGIEIYVINNTGSPLAYYAEADTAYDQYFDPYPAAAGTGYPYSYFYGFLSPSGIGPGDVHARVIYSWISSDAPDGHILKVPFSFYEVNTDTLLGRDTVYYSVTGADVYPPELIMEPRGPFTVNVADLITVWVGDGGAVTLNASILKMSDSSFVDAFQLYDDGTHGDVTAGDRWFSSTYTLTTEDNFWIIYDITDQDNNNSNFFYYRISSIPFVPANDMLLLYGGAMSYNPSFIRDGRTMMDVLDTLGYSYDVFDPFTQGSMMPDSSDLAQYQNGAVVYVFGPDSTDWKKLSYMNDLNISFWAADGWFTNFTSIFYPLEFAPVLQNYMGVVYEGVNFQPDSVAGIPEDPVSDGLGYYFQPGGYSFSKLIPVGTGEASMNYVTDGVAAVRNSTNDYKTYVSGIGPFRSLYYSANGLDLAQRVLSWMIGEQKTLSELVQDISDYIAGMDPSDFDKSAHQNVLVNQFANLASGIEGLNPNAALARLDGLRKRVDKWVTDADEKATLLAMIDNMIALLEAQEASSAQVANKGSGKGAKLASSATLPGKMDLLQNYPNPFNPSTSISYTVPDGSLEHVTLKVYDLRGRLIRTLVDRLVGAGSYSVVWDGSDESGRQVSSGVFLYRMQAGEFVQTRKMVILK